MTMCAYFGRFLKDRYGGSAAEFAMVLIIFVTIIFGIIDFSRALWHWNMAEKATQLGVRQAVVNNMVAAGLQTWDAVGAGYPVGTSVPANAIAPNPIVCTTGNCTGGWGYDGTAFDNIVNLMNSLYGAVQANNVTVEYRHIGLGLAGNPIGPHVDPAVTVKLTGLSFQFITPGLSGVVAMSMPDFSATLTAEDSTSTGAPTP